MKIRDFVWGVLCVSLLLAAGADRAAAQTPPGCGWMLAGPPAFTPTPSPTASPTPSPTPPTGWIDPLIVDNADPPPAMTFTGSWTLGSYGTDRWGADYRFAAIGDGSLTATFRPTIPAPGPYEIFEYHSAGTNRTTSAEILIQTATGIESRTVNQSVNGGRWNSLGVFQLLAGTDCYAQITNRTSTGSVVMADAFKFAYVNTVPSPTPTVTPTATPTPTGNVRPFGEYVQEVIDELEQRKATDVSGYLMKDLYGKYTGVTETLWYQGVSYMWNECVKGEAVNIGGSTYYPYGMSYCSGLTLEIFHRAMKKRDKDLGIAEANENWNGLGTKGIFIFKKLWNVIRINYSDTGQLVSDKPSPATALAMSGLGRIITYGEPAKFEDVQRYDFCDISRSTGSGHSVIFIDWIRAADNRIIGLRYYSSQSSTNGQGYGIEYFSGEGGTVLQGYFHAGRVYDHPAYNTANTIREAGYYSN